MKGLPMMIIAILGLGILAYNNHLVAGALDIVREPVKAWEKDPYGSKKPALVLDSPGFPDRRRERPAARPMGSPAAPQSGAPVVSFGARAVAVQRAKGL